MTGARRLSSAKTWTFVAVMLALAAVCVWLGTWQMQRLGEKEALIAAVDARLHNDPVPVPSADQWSDLDLEALAYQPVSLTGTFRYNQTVTVFTSLANARGPASGPGYWVVTPFVLADGGTVFVNRGFVPQDFQEAAVTDGQGDDSQVTISGLLRPAEAAGMMTPGPNMSDRIEWVRDPERLAAMVDPAMAPFAPFYIDMPAGPTGELPQGGETIIEFPNNHLGYAYTWYGFAIVAVVMLGFWFARERAAGKG
ncbi:MAG: SURF1 family protein [Devosia sp.]